MSDQEMIIVHTDGGCEKRHGIGAWAYVIRQGGVLREQKFGHATETTNNRMELTSVIEALKALEIGPSIVITSDSQYVVKGITEWHKKWLKNGWVNSNEQPVANKDLWEELIALDSLHSVAYAWVKGHSGNVDNEICDTLCTQAMVPLLEAAKLAGT